MFKARIIKNNNEIAFKLCASVEEANEWIQINTQVKSWGNPERELSEYDANLEGLDIQEAISSRQEQDLDNNIINYYTFASEFSYEIVDVSQEIALENKVKEGKLRQDLGAQIIARVYAINESKELTAENFNAIMNDPNLERIERLLWTGSLKTAKLMIQALDNTYFSNEEKQSILDMLVGY